MGKNTKKHDDEKRKTVDVAFKSIKIKFVTTYTCTHLILSIKKTMHGLVIKQCKRHE